MFSFMDNVKKVVSNVQDLAVNVMNELDEGRGNEESPHHSANISPTMDGPLEKLKKDATAASEMINNAANLLGEDEVFISLLSKLIKHSISSEKNEEKRKLFQEWSLVHDFDFSLNHSSNALQKLNDLAVELDKSIECKPLSNSETTEVDENLNGESKKVEKLQKELSQKSEVLKKFKQRLLEDGKQLKIVNAELAQKTEELLTLKEQSSEQLSTLQSRIKELEAENDCLQEDTQAIIQQQKEKLSQNEMAIQDYKKQLEELQKRLKYVTSELEDYNQQSMNHSTQNNENLLEEKESLEEELAQKSKNLEELQTHINGLKESEGKLRHLMEDATSETKKYKKELLQAANNDARLNEELANEKENCLKLKEEMRKFKEEMASVSEDLSNHQHTLEEEVQKYGMLQSELSKKTESLNALESVVKELRENEAKLVKSFNDVTTECESYKQQVANQFSENDEYQHELLKEKENLEQELAQKSKNFEELQARLNDVKENEEKLRQLFNDTTSETEKYKKKLWEATNKSVDENEMEMLKEKWKTEKEKCERLQYELNEYLQEIANLKYTLVEESQKYHLVLSDFNEKCQELSALQYYVNELQANEAKLNNSIVILTSECDNYKQAAEKAEAQMVLHSSDEQEKLTEKVNSFAVQCENYQGQIKELENQLAEKTVVIDELYKQINHMNSINTEEMTAMLQTLQQEVQRLSSELRASHDAQSKLQNHVQKLTDNLQAKDDEVSQLAAEMENQAVDGPRAINTVKEMLQTKIRECNMYAEKNEHLKRNIAQYNHQLQEKDQLVNELQKIRENLLAKNQHVEEEFKRCHAMLENLTTQTSQSDGATVKKLQDELTLLVNQYNIVKQVCFKMFIDEERGFDHSMLLINLLNYDEKSRNILKEYVTAKYQGTLEGFFKKFNFTSTAQLAQELLKFVDQDIAKSKISLAPPVTEPAFQMNVDETLSESSADTMNDLRNIIE